MNRRDFLRLSLLVPVALSTKLQVEGEKFEIISPSETFNKAFEGFSESFQKGYEMGQRIMEGYARGIVKHPYSEIETGMAKEGYVEGVRADYIPWEEMPEGLEVIELEWGEAPTMSWSDKPESVKLLWGESYLKPKFEIEKL